MPRGAPCLSPALIKYQLLEVFRFVIRIPSLEGAPDFGAIGSVVRRLFYNRKWPRPARVWLPRSGWCSLYALRFACVWFHSLSQSWKGARCSSVVRAFAHGAMGRRINPSWGGPIELFLVPASAPRLV